MELVSWAAGEPWSDFPECVPRDVARFCQRIHDAADPSDYAMIWTDDRLRRILRAPSDIDDIRKRAYIAAEYARRVAVQALRSHGIDTSRIDACALVTDHATAMALRYALDDAAAAAAAADAAAYAAAAAAADAAAAAFYAAGRQKARIEILDLWLAEVV